MLAGIAVAWAVILAAPAVAQHAVLWRDPGPIERLNLAAGPPGPRPAPPFRFLTNDERGRTPKIMVKDTRGRAWAVKFGDEARSETFASRMAWALGFYTEPSYFVRRGRIFGAHDAGRAHDWVQNGYLIDGRFEYRDPAYTFRKDVNWTWEYNPWAGTPELNGLKILTMLLSNWDNKDARDRDSNTAILDHRSGRGILLYYYVSDWGGSMGRWGHWLSREKWNCSDYREQTPDFLKVEHRRMKWGFSGYHDNDFKKDIRARDIRWLLRYLNPISDVQIRAALRASGASPHEVKCFSRSLRARINQLRRVAAMRWRTVSS
ncbi:MAG: hypothetical protein HYZ57_05150 [Acidobacteria bacterium]|nr:hypothetical protein [Acidobacteriota bacterium]MBI3279213.1 hypothetical protein [Acidobacteriota bacterium]